MVRKYGIALSLIISVATSMSAQKVDVDSLSESYPVNFSATIHTQAADGVTAPYYMSSLCDEEWSISPYVTAAKLSAFKGRDDSQTFSYSFGVEAIAGYYSGVEYDKWNGVQKEWQQHDVTPSSVRLQQLYASVKWRSLLLQGGMWRNSFSLFPKLGSGDFVYSNNARPVPQVRLGFVDFQNVPFTKGWLQVMIDVAYGKFTDSKWLQKQYNYYNEFVTTGTLMHHKRFYFRVAPQKNISFTVGLQHAAQFGGTYYGYNKGELIEETKLKSSLKQFFKILLPSQGDGRDYYEGNSLGSWDAILRYRLPEGDELSAYVQWPWEDGSGIGKLNGFDGIWGLSYKRNKSSWINELTLEYIDFTNQSGPIHWAPGDFPGTSIDGEATGADDYYNNYMYDGWANYGMSMGSPFVKSPAYNTDGYSRYLDNRVRGCHIGFSGTPASNWQYKVLFSHRTSWGTPFVPASHRRHDTSWSVQGAWTASSVPGLSVSAQLAGTHGSLYGDSFGVSVGVTYTGVLLF